MPKPNDGETRKEYISRCIPIVIDEGTAEKPDQAAAICHSMWEKAQGDKAKNMGEMGEREKLIKALSRDEQLQTIRIALERQFTPPTIAPLPAGSYYWVEYVYDNFAILNSAGKRWRVDFSVGEGGEVTSIGGLIEVEPEWQPVKGFWYAGSSDGDALKLGARNNRSDRERVRKIRKAARDIHDTTMEMESRDADDETDEPEMMESVAQMMGSMGKNVEAKSPPEGHEFYGNQWAGGGGGDSSGGMDINSSGRITAISKELKQEGWKLHHSDIGNDYIDQSKNGHRATIIYEPTSAFGVSGLTGEPTVGKFTVRTHPDNESGYLDIKTDYVETLGKALEISRDYLNTGITGKNLSVLIFGGGAVKAVNLGNGKTEVGGYLVTFGDETTPDLSPQRDYFDKATDFRLEFPGKSVVYFNHTMPITAGGRQIAISKPLKNASELTLDDIGVFAKAILDERDEYESLLIELANQGILNWSSGTAEHLVRRTPAKNGTNHIDVWPLGLDASLTHAPADWRNQVLPLKSLVGQGVIQLHAEQAQPEGAPEAVGDTAASDGQASEAAIKSTSPQKGAIKMVLTPELQEMVADVAKTAAAEAAKSAASEAVKAYQLATEKPVNDPGTLLPGTVAGISGDGQPADRPYKSIKAGGFAQFLSDVAFAARPGVAPDGKLQAIQSAGVKALGANEAIPSEGGWLVQTDHAAELYKLTFDSGVLSSRCNRKQITTNANGMTLNALEESSRATGSRFGGVRGYRLAEGGTPTSSKPAFRQMELKLKKFAALVYATDELLQDSGLLEQVVMEAAPAELAFMVDDDIMNGLGVAGPFGILNSPALVSVSAETGQAATTLVFENVVKMWARRWSRSSANYVWYINQDIEPQFYSMSLAVGTGGVPVYMPAGGISGQPYATLFGRPVIPTEFNASLGTAGDIVLADLTQYQLIDKGGVQGSSSMHVAFVTDEMVYRFIYRVDGQPLWASALTPYKGTGNTQSPFIALAARA